MSKRERKKRNLQPAQAAIDKMSPEERQEWYNFAKTKKFLSKKVEFQGKKVCKHARCCTCLTNAHAFAVNYFLLLLLLSLVEADIGVGRCYLQFTAVTQWQGPQPKQSFAQVLCVDVTFCLSIQTTIGKLVKEIQQEEQQQAGGEVNYTGKGKGAALDKVPGWELRPGAPKMQLRPDEEARLPLVCCIAQSCLPLVYLAKQ